MPFSLSEMIELASILRDVCLGLVELAYPDSRPTASFSLAKAKIPGNNAEEDTRLWMHLFKVQFILLIYFKILIPNTPLLTQSTVNLVRQLHTRDTRRPFCPGGVWVTGRIALPLERSGQLSFRRQSRLHRPFRAIRPLTRNEIGKYSVRVLKEYH